MFNKVIAAGCLVFLGCAAVGNHGIAQTSPRTDANSAGTSQVMRGDGEQTLLEVRVTDLANDPSAYVGKLVKVVGLVNDVCPVRGCWAKVEDAQDGSEIRFKVPDGGVVFTAKMIGDVVEASGTFTRYALNEQGQMRKAMEKSFRGEATYLLEGRDASLICSENSLTAI